MSDPAGPAPARVPRSELAARIASQEATICKYESRLKDVVRAYKGVVKEKEALEASLNAISVAGSRKQKQRKDGKTAATDPEAGPHAAREPEDSAGEEEESLEARVATLTASLATLAAEKSRTEAAMQEDRKKLISERRDREREAEELKSDLATARSASRSGLEEAKSRLIVERHEREKETNDHAIMLRELQKLVSEERRAREKVEAELFEAAKRSKGTEAAGVRKDDQEKKIRDLERKLKSRSEEMEALRAKAERPAAELERLRKSAFEQKLTHRRGLERAEARAEEAEARAAEARVAQEQRVTSLESRLQELSETVGTYDRLRAHDQQEIAKLKNRIVEVKERRETVNNIGGVSGISFTGAEMPELLSAFEKLKKAIVKAKANGVGGGAVDTDALFGLQWKADYEALKAEHASLQRRLEQAQRQQQQQSHHSLSEVDQELVLTLKLKAAELEDRVALLASQLSESEAERAAAEAREAAAREGAAGHRREAREAALAAESEHRSRMMHLETELQKQRDRCLTLIEEKEDEVAMLKSNVAVAFESAFASSSSPDGKSGAAAEAMQLRMAAVNLRSSSGSRSRKTSLAASEITDGLKSSNAAGDGMVLHYEQELSLRDVEIGSLRDKVKVLESAMREIQASFHAKEERHADRADRLEAEVARLSRMSKSCGGDKLNLEYLKNVVLRYMLSSDAGDREHMLKAIGAVLVFTKSEAARVSAFNASWWRMKK